VGADYRWAATAWQAGGAGTLECVCCDDAVRGPLVAARFAPGPAARWLRPTTRAGNQRRWRTGFRTAAAGGGTSEGGACRLARPLRAAAGRDRAPARAPGPGVAAGRPPGSENAPARAGATAAHVLGRVALVRLHHGGAVLLQHAVHAAGAELRQPPAVVKHDQRQLRVALHRQLHRAAHQARLAARKRELRGVGGEGEDRVGRRDFAAAGPAWWGAGAARDRTTADSASCFLCARRLRAGRAESARGGARAHAPSEPGPGRTAGAPQAPARLRSFLSRCPGSGQAPTRPRRKTNALTARVDRLPGPRASPPAGTHRLCICCCGRASCCSGLAWGRRLANGGLPRVRGDARV
jgi:hypothetical protein